MQNYDEFITVKDYVKDLKENGYAKNPTMSAQDYAKTLKEQCVKFQSQSLMTVEDYVKTLSDRRYVTPLELEIAESVEANLQDKKSEEILNKAEKDALIVEKLLA